MSEYKQKGVKQKYDFLDKDCIGRPCWAPGMFQHRGATLSGSRNTSSPPTPCCMNRAYHGCPQPLPGWDYAKSKQRREQGWKKV